MLSSDPTFPLDKTSVTYVRYFQNIMQSLHELALKADPHPGIVAHTYFPPWHPARVQLEEQELKIFRNIHALRFIYVTNNIKSRYRNGLCPFTEWKTLPASYRVCKHCDRLEEEQLTIVGKVLLAKLQDQLNDTEFPHRWLQTLGQDQERLAELYSTQIATNDNFPS